MLNKIFKHHIGRNIEVYMDDMMVKSRTFDTHLTNLTETFDTLKRFNMCINPSKCTFGVSSSKFLGFIIH